MKTLFLIMLVCFSAHAEEYTTMELKWIDFTFVNLPMNVITKCEFEFSDSVLISINRSLWNELDKKEKRLEIKRCINSLSE